MTRIAAAFISMIFHAACSVGGQVQDPAAPAPTLEEIRGATITGLFGEPVTLNSDGTHRRSRAGA